MLPDIFGDVLPENYTTTVFGALELGLASVPQAQRDVLLALEPFEAGMPIPVPLIQLAVGQVLKQELTESRLEFLLGRLCEAGLLVAPAVWDNSRSAPPVLQREYLLMELVAMFLGERQYSVPRDGDRWQQRASVLLFSNASIDSYAQQLLAVFLLVWGKPATQQQAHDFLVGLRTTWYPESLAELSSSTRHARNLAYSVDVRNPQAPPQVLADLLARQADIKRLQGKYDAALKEFDMACHMQPFNSFALRGRGFVHAALGKDDAAQQDLKLANDLEPNCTYTKDTVLFASHQARRVKHSLKVLRRQPSADTPLLCDTIFDSQYLID